jgi:hypothetical protein
MRIVGPTQIRRRRDLFPSWDRLDERCLLSGLSPASITSAYDLGAITLTARNGSTVKGNGAGETIALIEAYHDPSIASDLHVFDTTYGLPDPTLTVVDQAGGQTNDDWALEESLDVEWAHAIAPAANILVVEAGSQTVAGLIAAVNTAKSTPGVVAISMSWGFNEFANESSYNSTFTTPGGHTGITFLAASGDSGLAAGPEWPSVAPTVVSVGGTTLFLGSSGAYQSETPWIGSSGGYSRYEGEPSYQRSVQGSGRRASPDVAFDGDPNTGVSVYETSLETGLGSWETVGGTSLGTPAWAAIIAIVDQGRALAGKGSLDGPTQTLPALYALPSSDFHAVDSYARRGLALAAETANTSTGRGTPVGQAVVAGLVASNGSTTLSTSTSVARAVRKTVPRARVRIITAAGDRVAHRAHALTVARTSGSDLLQVHGG